jgi:CheY-like chemotaxis protein
MRKIKALLVDDDLPTPWIDSYSEFLTNTGEFSVIVTKDPEKALEIALKEQPDVALVDIGMPDMDGGVVASKFREEPRLADMAIVYVTGHMMDQNDIRIGGGKIGHYRVIVKDERREKHLARIASAITAHLKRAVE